MSAKFASAVYTGRVTHHRQQPNPHHFGYSICMLYLDLSEIDAIFSNRWFWSTKRWAPGAWRREDYLDPEIPSLDEAVRQRAFDVLGKRPTGPIRMLTQPRYFGYVFNPVSFYYCFDDDEQLIAILAEITNTPWKERHVYLLPAGDDQACAEFAKAFHISPFMGMEQHYKWQLSAPGKSLAVNMQNWEGEELVFHAAMTLQRRPISSASLAMALVGFPMMTAKIVAGIYWQALRLWFKRTPFHPHPAEA